MVGSLPQASWGRAQKQPPDYPKAKILFHQVAAIYCRIQLVRWRRLPRGTEPIGIPPPSSDRSRRDHTHVPHRWPPATGSRVVRRRQPAGGAAHTELSSSDSVPSLPHERASRRARAAVELRTRARNVRDACSYSTRLHICATDRSARELWQYSPARFPPSAYAECPHGRASLLPSPRLREAVLAARLGAWCGSTPLTLGASAAGPHLRPLLPLAAVRTEPFMTRGRAAARALYHPTNIE